MEWAIAFMCMVHWKFPQNQQKPIPPLFRNYFYCYQWCARWSSSGDGGSVDYQGGCSVLILKVYRIVSSVKLSSSQNVYDRATWVSKTRSSVELLKKLRGGGQLVSPPPFAHYWLLLSMMSVPVCKQYFEIFIAFVIEDYTHMLLIVLKACHKRKYFPVK